MKKNFLTKSEKNMMIFFIVASIIAIIGIAIKFAFFPDPDPQSTTALLSESKKEELAKLAKTDERFQYIYNNLDLYSVEIIDYYFARKEPSDKVIEYIYNYPKYANVSDPIKYTEEELNAKIPMLFQNDPRWSYKPYGGDGGGFLGYQACFNTSFSMAYIALTRDGSVNPYSNSIECGEKGFLGIGGTKTKAILWLCDKYNFNCEEYIFDENNKPNEQIIRDALVDGKVLFCNVKAGTISTGGHSIILREYVDGQYYINDPASEENCYTPYRFDVLSQDLKSLYILSSN